MKLSWGLAKRVAPAFVAFTAFALPFFAISTKAIADDDDDDKPARTESRDKDKGVETKFTRLREGRNHSLDVAFASYKNPDTEVELVLYGAVHIADKAYYKKVQKDLDSCDVVLYEMVTPGKDQKPDESMQTIGELQTAMGEMLGLTFQKDGINYKAKNLVHADMSYDDLMKATDGDISKALPGADMFKDPNMAKQLKPMLKMMKSMGKDFMKSMPGVRDQMKSMMAQQLAGADMAQLPGGEDAMKILVGERNKVALKVLDQELAKRKSGKVAIFYGAAHMKDFNKRLAEKGWKQTKVEWNVAWNLSGKHDDEDDDDAPATAPEREKAPAREKAPSEKGQARWF